MERREFLKNTAVLSLAAGTSAAITVPGAALVPEAQTTGKSGDYSDDVVAALARFRETIPASFDPAYVENAVIPFFLTRSSLALLTS